MVVLVGYATAHGSTREIAERIASRLAAEHGLYVETTALRKDTPLGTADAYVLGSAVHGQAWLPSAVAFVREHRDALGERPVWLFSVGARDALHGALGSRMAARYPVPKGIAELRSALHAREHRILTGVLRREDFPAPGRLFLRVIGARYGDFRDWPAIESWADEIAHALTVPPG